MPGIADIVNDFAAGALAWAVGWQEIVVIVIVVLILFGGRKIPELAKGLGKGLREFKREMQGVRRDFEESVEEEDDYDRPRPRKRRRKPRPEPEDVEAEADEDAPDDQAPAEPQKANAQAKG